MAEHLIGFNWKFKFESKTWDFSPLLLNRLGYDTASIIEAEEIFAFTYKQELEKELLRYTAEISPSTFSNAAMCKRKDGALAIYVFKGFKNLDEQSIEGEIIPIQEHLNSLKEVEDAHLRMQLISEGFQTGIWDWNILTGHEWWSDQFYRLLGFEPEEIEPTFQTFIEVLLHPDDREGIEQAIALHLNSAKEFRKEIRLKTKLGDYRWFETSGKAAFKEGVAERMCGAIIDIHLRKSAELEVAVHEYLLRESGKLVKVGAWEIDLSLMKPLWSQGVYDIHEVPEGYEPDMETAINFYVAEHLPIISECVTQLIEKGIPFDIELQIITAKQNRIWVRAAAEAVRNEKGDIIRVRGVFQDIDEAKKKELDLVNSMDIIGDQNQRLLNFAHIVSHNLRSHTGNLELMLHMMDSTNDQHEKEVYLDQIRKVSQNLNETITNLNEVVAIQTDFEKQISQINLEDIASSTLTIFESDIEKLQIKIVLDFEAWKELDYVKSYMESIFLNMISNAIKYRDPQRSLELIIRTEIRDNNKCLIFSDNGSGIDLERYGSKVFGMYKTFHRNKDSRGIGLFLTKNQIESLGGNITLTSELGKGTSFKIKFTK